MSISKYLAAGVAAAISILCCAEGRAATVSGVYNTGVDSNNNVLVNGAVDTHYSVVNPAGPTYAYTSIFYGSHAPDSKFITYAPGDPDGFHAVGTTTYSTTFSLTGYNPATASLSGLISADDAVTISLNGQLVYTSPNPAYSSLFAFSTSQSFISGVNTLSFAVTNTGSATGFEVSGLKVTALGTPGPIAGSGLPALAGLFGLWFVRRGRSSRAD